MTELINMIYAIEEIEVRRTRLDDEVNKLAARAYPNSDDERHMSQPICYHEDSTQLKQDCNK